MSYSKFSFLVIAFMVGLLATVGFMRSQEAGQETAGSARSVADLEPLHQFHVNELDLACTDCHSVPESPAQGHELSYTERPYHTTCELCHADVFEAGELGAFCAVCHVPGTIDVSPFPSGRTSVSGFSHNVHVDPRGRVNKQSGLRQDCIFCHEMGQEGMFSVASHPECAGCHAGMDAVQPVLSEDAGRAGCLACHDMMKLDQNIVAEAMGESHAESPMQRVQHGNPHDPYQDVVAFPHHLHEKTLNGAVIQCTSCHEGILQQSDADMASAALPSMDECASCHDVAAKVGTANLTENCEVCHTAIEENFRPGHEGFALDIAHTVTFRRHHEEQARETEGYCDYCHDLSRSTGNSCANCHSVMMPESHFAARFSETTHGRLAAMEREACATCHEVDFCSRCHNIPPRSHTPLALFAGGGLHRDLAALNLRSCFACHTFEADCALCHSQILR